jgi:pentatricopeptide repeat protein
MNAAIDMYVKCRCIEKAVEVLEGMEEESVMI